MSVETTPEPPAGCAWHYTSADGLLGIIQSNSVWATSAAFMNDANEMKTGVRALQSSYQLLEPHLSAEDRNLVESSSLLHESSVDSLFLVSASREPDLLTLWRYYGRDQVAYSVGLDRSTALAPRAQRDGDEHPSPPPAYEEEAWDEDGEGRPFRMYDPDSTWVFGGTWKDVDYVQRMGTVAHASHIRRFIESHKKAIERGSFCVDLGAVADSPINLEKDDAFKDEAELRIVIEINPSWKFVKYRSTRFGLTPYVELGGSLSGADTLPPDLGERLPIRHIRIGPSADPKAARRALRGLLNDSGYGEVDVSVSDIPFR